MPEHIASILHAVDILLGYGRHLLDTVRHRAAAPTFPTIAACFGTANLSTILAHLNRGILRAAALERFLLARAATGRDITSSPPAPAPTNHSPRQHPPKPNRQPTSQPGPKPHHARRCPPARTIPNSSCPHRRISIARCAVAPSAAPSVEICGDLAVVPGLCTPAFWNGLFELMHYFGGSVVVTVMKEKAHREQAFIQEQDKKLGSTLDWLHLKRDEIRESPRLLHRRTTGRSIRRGTGHRPTLTPRSLTST